jgi:hypothetical protein
MVIGGLQRGGNRRFRVVSGGFGCSGRRARGRVIECKNCDEFWIGIDRFVLLLIEISCHVAVYDTVDANSRVCREI